MDLIIDISVILDPEHYYNVAINNKNNFDRYITNLIHSANLGFEQGIKLLNTEYNNTFDNNIMHKLNDPTGFIKYLNDTIEYEWSMYQLGVCYMYTDYIVENNNNISVKLAKSYMNKAIELLQLNIDKFGGRGYCELGRIYNLQNDEKKAHGLYEKGLEKGYMYCLSLLGFMYIHGQYVEVDYDKAKELFERGIENNIPSCLYGMGLLHYKKSEFNIAKRYYKQAKALNYHTATNELGNMYKDGKGVKKNCIIAKELFELGYKYNNLWCTFSLAELYQKGANDGVNTIPISYTNAHKYYKIDKINSESLNNLGVLYYNGQGVVRNISVAKDYFKKSLIYRINYDAHHNLGLIYSSHNNFYNKKKAFYHYELAANGNNYNGMVSLAKIYANGTLDVKKDNDKVIELYKKCLKIKEDENMRYRLCNAYNNCDDKCDKYIKQVTILIITTKKYVYIDDICNKLRENKYKVFSTYIRAVNNLLHAKLYMLGFTLLTKLYCIQNEQCFVDLVNNYEFIDNNNNNDISNTIIFVMSKMKIDYIKKVNELVDNNFHNDAYLVINHIINNIPDFDRALLDIIKKIDVSKVVKCSILFIMTNNLLKTNVDIMELHFKYSPTNSSQGFHEAKKDFYNLVLTR
jgi:TPR repeat protein